MPNLREIEERLLAEGRVNEHGVELLRQVLDANGRINREKADFLVELHKRMPHRTPAFDRFFYQAIKDSVLATGRIGPKKTEWLRQMLFDKGKIEDEERKLLHQLKGEAQEVSPEFEALYRENMKQPPEWHTSG